MTYLKAPNTVRAGAGLKQTPVPTTPDAGIVPVTFDAEIASTTGLGVVQIGSGLAITPEGLLSATGGSGSNATRLITMSAIALPSDYYIGAQLTAASQLTLPLNPADGVEFVIKLEYGSVGSKKLKIQPTGTAKIDNQNSVTLEDSYATLNIIARGNNWWII